MNNSSAPQYCLIVLTGTYGSDTVIENKHDWTQQVVLVTKLVSHHKIPGRLQGLNPKAEGNLSRIIMSHNETKQVAGQEKQEGLVEGLRLMNARAWNYFLWHSPWDIG